MIIPDTNLLLYAYDSTSPFHDKARVWWETCLSGKETVGLCPMVLFAFVRIGTHRRAYEHPMSVDVAANNIETWFARKVCRFIPMELMDVEKAISLLKQLGMGGDLTTDAQIAAVALRTAATIHSADTDFCRFPGVKVVNPLAMKS